MAMDDVRYSELVFLRDVATRRLQSVFGNDPAQSQKVTLDWRRYTDMVVTLAEDLCIEFDDPKCQTLVRGLRRELHGGIPRNLGSDEWDDPRRTLDHLLTIGQPVQLRITYRGLRRIDELRGLLREDRILDHLGVLLDIRYLNADVDDALGRPAGTSVSVLYADMDHFKPINDTFGHEAGDVVMKAYLDAMRDAVGDLGVAYRGKGDEVVALIIGQGQERAVEIAERARAAVAQLGCHHRGRSLPGVSASIGVASTPPEQRSRELVSIAEARNRQAKGLGRDRVVAE